MRKLDLNRIVESEMNFIAPTESKIETSFSYVLLLVGILWMCLLAWYSFGSHNTCPLPDQFDIHTLRSLNICKKSNSRIIFLIILLGTVLRCLCIFYFKPKLENASSQQEYDRINRIEDILSAISHICYIPIYLTIKRL
jgi:hypothetical protein